MNKTRHNQVAVSQRGRLGSLLLSTMLLAGAGGARFVQPLTAAHASIACYVNSGSVAHFTPCEGAPGTFIKVMMTRAISSPPLLLQFQAVVSAGVPAQVSTPLSGGGTLYMGIAPLALCINTSGSRSWNVFLVDTMRRAWGNIGQYTVDCRPGIAPNNPSPIPIPAATANPNPGQGQPFGVLSSYVLDFGAVQVGSRSAPQAVRLTTLGTVPLQIGPSSLRGTGAGAFTIVSNNCGGTQKVGASCAESVVFSPVAFGTFLAELYISNAANRFVGHYVKLTGRTWFSKAQALLRTATATPTPGSGGNPGGGAGPTPVKNPPIVPPVQIPAPEAILHPMHLDFGDHALHTPSGAQTVTLSNTGNAALTFDSNTTIHGDTAFTIENDTCSGQTISIGATCTVAVTFTPADAMDYSANLAFSDNSPSHYQLVPLTGHGHPAPTTFSTDPTDLSFGQVDTKTMSEARTVTVTDNGPEQITFSTDPSISGDDARVFSITSDGCAGKTLNDGDTCAIALTFTPEDATAYSAHLDLTAAGAASAQSVALSGQGHSVSSAFSLDEATLSFGTVDGGSTSAAQSVTLKDDGPEHITFSSDPSISGADASAFTITDDGCAGKTLNSAETCTVSLTFAPPSEITDSTDYSATLEFNPDGADGAQSVSLTGMGTPASTNTPDSSGTGSGSSGDGSNG